MNAIINLPPLQNGKFPNFKVSTSMFPKQLEFELIKEVSLSLQQLEEYVNQYYSDELETSFNLQIKENYLGFEHRFYASPKLLCIDKDIFLSPQYGAKLIFKRNKSNQVNGFFLDLSRMHDMWFRLE